jgi:hypothetical protein
MDNSDSRGDRPHGPAPASELNGDRPHGPAPASELGERRDPAVGPGGDRSKPEHGHETSDVSISAIVKFGVALAIATAVVGVGMWGLLRFFEVRRDEREVPVPSMVAANLQRTPSGPRLEADPLAPRRAVQAREDAVLTSYGWVDPKAGVARIPIDRAMELLVQRGLPPPGRVNAESLYLTGQTQEFSVDPRTPTP